MSPILRLRRRLRNLACLFAALGLLFIRMRSLVYSVPQLPALTMVALFLLMLWRNLWRKTNTSALPPRVKGRLPGNIDILWQLVKGESNEYCASTLHRWEQSYGATYDMNILWSHQIVTSDPTNIEELLATKFEAFEKSGRFRDMLENFLGDGIFTSDGDAWRRHRVIARPFFAHQRTSDYDLFERHSSKLMTKLIECAQNRQSLDIQDQFLRLTVDSIAEFLLGLHLDTLRGNWSNTGDDLSDFVTAFEELQRISMTRIRIGSNWPIFEIFGDKSEKPAQTLNRFVEPIVEQAFKNKGVEEPGSMPRDQTYLQFLVNQLHDGKAVRDSVVSLLLAGRDTTASLLSFTTYCLAMHPEITLKIRREIQEVLGSADRPPTEEELKSMRYLRAVVNESLRLFPPVPMNIRRAAHTTTLSSPLSKGGPFVVPKDVSITYAPILMQRRRDVWGDDSTDFKPDRWINSKLNKKDSTASTSLKEFAVVANRFAFVPFNAGPRLCLGLSFALAECMYTLVRLLQKFEGFEIDESKQVMPPQVSQPNVGSNRRSQEKCWPRASLTLYVEGGLWVRPILRDCDTFP